MQRDGTDAALFELTSQTVRAVLGPSEDDGALVFFDDVGGELGTLVARHAPEVVVNVVGGFFADHVVNGGVIGEFLDE